MTEVYEIVKEHLELKDNWYNNPYLPKEKVEALLQALAALMTQTHHKSKLEGQKEMLVGLSIFMNEVLDAKKQEIGLRDEQSVSSYIKWQEKFYGTKKE